MLFFGSYSQGGKQFRLEYKNFYSLDLAKDGTGQVYNTKMLGCKMYARDRWPQRLIIYVCHCLRRIGNPIIAIKGHCISPSDTWDSATRRRICLVISTQRSKLCLSYMIRWRRVSRYEQSLMEIWRLTITIMMAEAPLDGPSLLKSTALSQNALVASTRRWSQGEHSRWWTIQDRVYAWNLCASYGWAYDTMLPWPAWQSSRGSGLTLESEISFTTFHNYHAAHFPFTEVGMFFVSMRTPHRFRETSPLCRSLPPDRN